MNELSRELTFVLMDFLQSHGYEIAGLTPERTYIVIKNGVVIETFASPDNTENYEVLVKAYRRALQLIEMDIVRNTK